MTVRFYDYSRPGSAVKGRAIGVRRDQLIPMRTGGRIQDIDLAELNRRAFAPGFVSRSLSVLNCD